VCTHGKRPQLVCLDERQRRCRRLYAEVHAAGDDFRGRFAGALDRNLLRFNAGRDQKSQCCKV